MPQLQINNRMLEVVEEFKLLGVMVRSDLSWHANTQYICKKGYMRLWMLRKLKVFGANQTEMVDVYTKQIRSVLELAVPVWEPGLTMGDSYQIERVQKCAMYIIMGDQYTSYDNARIVLNIDKLSDRRTQLCLKFARKSEKHTKYQKWFCYSDETVQNVNTRYQQPITKYKPVPTRTMRFKNSPLPYLTDLLNEYYAGSEK